MRKIYQIKISLRNSHPNIWRRLLVLDDVLLSKFHFILQTTMGWHNSHLHQFKYQQIIYLPYQEEDSFWRINNTVNYKKDKIRLNDILKTEKSRMIYEYDFGDGWLHDIVLEKILEAEKKNTIPVVHYREDELSA